MNKFLVDRKSSIFYGNVIEYKYIKNNESTLKILMSFEVPVSDLKFKLSMIILYEYFKDKEYKTTKQFNDFNNNKNFKYKISFNHYSDNAYFTIDVSYINKNNLIKINEDIQNKLIEFLISVVNSFKSPLKYHKINNIIRKYQLKYIKLFENQTNRTLIYAETVSLIILIFI